MKISWHAWEVKTLNHYACPGANASIGGNTDTNTRTNTNSNGLIWKWTDLRAEVKTSHYSARPWAYTNTNRKTNTNTFTSTNTNTNTNANGFLWK